MKKWFFKEIHTFEAKEGFKTRFIVQVEGKTFPHLWELVEVKPMSKISYGWCYEGFSGRAIVTFSLTEIENGVKLKLTHTVTEDFSEDVPEFSRENCANGWNYFIKEQLKDYIS